MASAIPVPEQPGRLFIPSTGSVVQQDSQYEGAYFDTIYFAALTTGQTKNVFKDQTGNSESKEAHHTNVTQSKRIPSHTRLKMYRLGVYVRQTAKTVVTAAADTIALYDMAHLKFLLGATNTVAEGPLLTFPSGFGVTGATTENSVSALTLGVASTAAAPQLMEKQDINDKMDINCQIKIDDQKWMTGTDARVAITATVLVTVFASGVITRPLGA